MLTSPALRRALTASLFFFAVLAICSGTVFAQNNTHANRRAVVRKEEIRRGSRLPGCGRACGSLLTLLLVAVFGLSVAHADTINFVLNNSVQSGAAGSTLTYDATVSAPSTNSGTVFLDSDTFTVVGPFTLDDSHFLNDFPLSLDPNTSFTGALYTLFIPAGTAAGLYTGSSFQILFSDVTGLESRVSQDFAVQVTAPSAVPEPGTRVLLVTGVGALAVVVYCRRRAAGFVRAA